MKKAGRSRGRAASGGHRQDLDLDFGRGRDRAIEGSAVPVGLDERDAAGGDAGWLLTRRDVPLLQAEISSDRAWVMSRWVTGRSCDLGTVAMATVLPSSVRNSTSKASPCA